MKSNFWEENIHEQEVPPPNIPRYKCLCAKWLKTFFILHVPLPFHMATQPFGIDTVHDDDKEENLITKMMECAKKWGFFGVVTMVCPWS